jgi:acetyl esterase/lipase
MIEVFAILLAVAAVVWVIVVVFLTAPDHSHFDEPRHGLHRNRAELSAQNDEVLRLINAMQELLRGGSRRKRIYRLRRIMDEGFTGSPAEAEQLGVEITATDANGVAAEWVVATDASPDQRLLYIHGGGFVVGSLRSHRMITAALSKACGVTVLAIDYRLLPEHRRKAAIADCQNAYRFMLENGPSGKGTAHEVYVAGDSAGGNLTLMLSAWARDENIRRIRILAVHGFDARESQCNQKHRDRSDARARAWSVGAHATAAQGAGRADCRANESEQSLDVSFVR